MTSAAYEVLTRPDEIAAAQNEARESRRAAGLPTEDLRVGVLADDPYLRMERNAVRFPDGSLGLYNRIIVPSGATVLPVLGDRMVLIERFRHGTRSWHLEAPRGALSGSTNPLGDAERELLKKLAPRPWLASAWVRCMRVPAARTKCTTFSLRGLNPMVNRKFMRPSAKFGPFR